MGYNNPLSIGIVQPRSNPCMNKSFSITVSEADSHFASVLPADWQNALPDIIYSFHPRAQAPNKQSGQRSLELIRVSKRSQWPSATGGGINEFFLFGAPLQPAHVVQRKSVQQISSASTSTVELQTSSPQRSAPTTKCRSFNSASFRQSLRNIYISLSLCISLPF